MGGYEAHGLLAGALVLGVDAPHGAGDGYAPRLLHPPHRHAEVVGLHDDDGAANSQLFVQGVGHLRRQALLELGPAGVRLYHPDQLGQTHDPLVRYVTYMGLADEWQEVVFAHRGKRYVSYEDHLVMLFLESYVQVPGRVFAQPGEEELVGLGDALRRVSQAFSFRVLAYGGQYLPDGPLDARSVYPVF